MANNIPTILRALTYKATDLQRSTLALHLEVTKGFLEAVEVRGSDTIIPTAEGRAARNRVTDRLGIELTGWVQGTGASEALRLASFAALRDELTTLFDPTAAAGALAGDDYAGDTRTIQARPLGDGLKWGPQIVPGLHALVVLLEAVDGTFWQTS